MALDPSFDLRPGDARTLDTPPKIAPRGTTIEYGGQPIPRHEIEARYSQLRNEGAYPCRLSRGTDNTYYLQWFTLRVPSDSSREMVALPGLPWHI